MYPSRFRNYLKAHQINLKYFLFLKQVDSEYNCQVECYVRTGICGAWSFNKNEKKCHLFSVNSCCNQFNNKESEFGWISGYICPYCWSTVGVCPCDDEFLQLGIRPDYNETLRVSL